MHFSFSTYYRECYEIPLLFLAINLLFFIYGLGYGILQVYREGISKTLITRFILLCIILISFSSIYVGPLASGGLILREERYEDAVELSGTLEGIRELSVFTFPEFGGSRQVPSSGSGTGYEYSVSGVKVRAPDRVPFHIGDHV